VRSFKTELDLNNQQQTLCTRHAYNWALALCKQLLNHNKNNPTDKIKFPTAIDLHKLLVASVKVDNPWYYQSSKCAPQEALRNLTKAFKRMHQVKKGGFPRFKKKNIRDSFYIEGSLKISGNKIKLPTIGWVKCHEQLPSVNPKNVTISKRADRWFIAFKLDSTSSNNQLLGEPVGVDLGINTLATCSNGFVAENPKAYKKSKTQFSQTAKRILSSYQRRKQS
jgi:putative transposase